MWGQRRTLWGQGGTLGWTPGDGEGHWSFGGTLDGTKALGGVSGDREECAVGTLKGKVGGDKEGMWQGHTEEF